MLLTKIIKFLETPGFVYFSMGLKVEYLGFAPSVSSGGLEGSLSSQQVGYMPQILTHWPEITDDGCTRVLHSPTWFGSCVNFDLIASILYPFYSVSASPALFAHIQLVCIRRHSCCLFLLLASYFPQVSWLTPLHFGQPKSYFFQEAYLLHLLNTSSTKKNIKYMLTLLSRENLDMYFIPYLFMDISFCEHISMPLDILGSTKTIIYSCTGCTLHKGITSHVDIIELYIYYFSVPANRSLGILF